jgi:hypothetical protein
MFGETTQDTEYYLSSNFACVASHQQHKEAALQYMEIQGDSKLLSGFPWPIIFKPETTK